MARDVDSVRLLEADPELGADMSAARFERARTSIVVSVLRLSPGPWLPSVVAAEPGHLGMLVLQGALTRDVELAGRAGTEVLGPGDLVRPWHHVGLEAPVPSRVRWRVLTPALLATIDRQIVTVGAAFPEVLAVLVARCSPVTSTASDGRGHAGCVKERQRGMP